MCVNVVTALNVWVVCLFFHFYSFGLQLKLKGGWGCIQHETLKKPLVSDESLLLCAHFFNMSFLFYILSFSLCELVFTIGLFNIGCFLF